jgi:hypothetical protein
MLPAVTFDVSTVIGIIGMLLMHIMAVSPARDYRRAAAACLNPAKRQSTAPSGALLTAADLHLPGFLQTVFSLGASLGFTALGAWTGDFILMLFSALPVPFGLRYVTLQLRLLPTVGQTPPAYSHLFVFTVAFFPTLLLAYRFFLTPGSDATWPTTLLSLCASAYSISVQAAPLSSAARVIRTRDARVIHRGFLATATIASGFMAIYYAALRIPIATISSSIATFCCAGQWVLVLIFGKPAAPRVPSSSECSLSGDLPVSLPASPFASVGSQLNLAVGAAADDADVDADSNAHHASPAPVRAEPSLSHCDDESSVPDAPIAASATLVSRARALSKVFTARGKSGSFSASRLRRSLEMSDTRDAEGLLQAAGSRLTPRTSAPKPVADDEF